MRDGVPDAIVLDGPNPYVKEAPDHYGPNGHLTLELDGPRIVETFQSPTGEVLFQQSIE